MGLKQLYYFRSVAEYLHFTKASEKLDIKQSSLSHSINTLEKELGVPLFERDGRGVKLTKYGEIFLNYVTQALDILDDGKNVLDEFINPEKGMVSLGYFSSLEEFIPYVVSEYYSATGNIYKTFQFYQMPLTDMPEALVRGSCDIVFSTVIEDEPRFGSYRIGEHNVVVIVPLTHALAKQDTVDLAHLNNENFITYDYQSRVRKHIDGIFALAGVSPKIIAETTHDTIIYSSVAAGFGVAIVPTPLGIKHYNVKVLKIVNEMPEREMFITWKEKQHMSPAVKQFRDFIISRGDMLDEYRRMMR